MANEAGAGGTGGQNEDGGTGGSGGATGGSAGAGDAAAGGSAGSGPACPKGLPGPKLIEVSTPGGTKYCIDSTEVTRGQYDAFKAAKGSDTSGQDPECAWNDDYENWEGCQLAPPADEPAFCTDWCDAMAYCRWAGKHLCGKVGGGKLTLAEANDPNMSEWYNVCSNGGETKFPYGDDYDVGACAYEDNPALAGETFPVKAGTAPDCHGVEQPFDAVYDMSGNVGEWTNACTGDLCAAPGGGAGSFLGETERSCRNLATGNPRSRVSGIRCCAPLDLTE